MCLTTGLLFLGVTQNLFFFHLNSLTPKLSNSLTLELLYPTGKWELGYL